MLFRSAWSILLFAFNIQYAKMHHLSICICHELGNFDFVMLVTYVVLVTENQKLTHMPT